MLNASFIPDALTYSRDLVNDQDWLGVQRLLGTSDIAFDASLGLGVATNTSILYALVGGGFADQEVVAVCRYTSTTTVGSEDFGILLRFLTNHSPNATYYYFRVDGQQAKITKVVDGTFTTLTQVSFALPQDTDVTITASAVGGVVTARFVAGALDETLTAADSSIAAAGLVGFRTQSSTGYLKSLDLEQVA